MHPRESASHCCGPSEKKKKDMYRNRKGSIKGSNKKLDESIPKINEKDFVPEFVYIWCIYVFAKECVCVYVCVRVLC